MEAALHSIRSQPEFAGDVRARCDGDGRTSFDDLFIALFDAHHDRVFRVLNRLTGDPEQARDIAQEAFVKLYRKGSAPDAPEAWLITVALNLFRNAHAKRTRRRRLLTLERGRAAHSDPMPAPDRGADSDAETDRVRSALDSLPERDRALLLLAAEGYSYRDIAAALDLRSSSVGTLLSRAKTRFRERCEELRHAR